MLPTKLETRWANARFAEETYLLSLSEIEPRFFGQPVLSLTTATPFRLATSSLVSLEPGV
jgi:hypothetical protein